MPTPNEDIEAVSARFATGVQPKPVTEKAFEAIRKEKEIVIMNDTLHRDHHRHGYSAEEAIADNTRQMDANFLGTSRQVGEGFIGNAREMCEAFRDLAVAVEKNGAANAVATEKNGAANSLATEKTGAANSLATEKTGAATQLAIEKTAAATQLYTSSQFSNTQNAIISGFKDGRYDAASFASQSMVEAAKNQSATALAFKDTQIRMEQIQSALAAKQAECCCELKELIREEAGKGRDLTNAIEQKRADRELNDARAEILFLRGRVTVPGIAVPV